MSTKIAFLFPGQGSQSVGMGRNLAERFPAAAETFAEADDACGFPLSRLCFEGPDEELKLTACSRLWPVDTRWASGRPTWLREHSTLRTRCGR